MTEEKRERPEQGETQGVSSSPAEEVTTAPIDKQQTPEASEPDKSAQPATACATATATAAQASASLPSSGTVPPPNPPSASVVAAKPGHPLSLPLPTTTTSSAPAAAESCGLNVPPSAEAKATSAASPPPQRSDATLPSAPTSATLPNAAPVSKKRKTPPSAGPASLLSHHPPPPAPLHAQHHNHHHHNHHHYPHPAAGPSSISHQLLVDSVAIQQTTRDIIALLQQYGPLTAGQIEYNIPPLVLSTATSPSTTAPPLPSAMLAPPPGQLRAPVVLPTQPAPTPGAPHVLTSDVLPAQHPQPLPLPKPAPSSAAPLTKPTPSSSSSTVLLDVLQILVAVGLVQTLVPPKGPATSSTSDSHPSPPTRYCMGRGIPRADAVLPTAVWDELLLAHDEAERAWERRNRLADALTIKSPRHNATTATGATAAGTQNKPPPPQPPSANPTPLGGASAPIPGAAPASAPTTTLSTTAPTPRQLLQKLADDFPEVLRDPVYVTALRNLHVDVDHRHGPSTAKYSRAAGGAGRGAGAQSRRKGKKKDATSTAASNTGTNPAPNPATITAAATGAADANLPAKPGSGDGPPTKKSKPNPKIAVPAAVHGTAATPTPSAPSGAPPASTSDVPSKALVQASIAEDRSPGPAPPPPGTDSTAASTSTAAAPSSRDTKEIDAQAAPLI